MSIEVVSSEREEKQMRWLPGLLGNKKEPVEEVAHKRYVIRPVPPEIAGVSVLMSHIIRQPK